MSGVDVLAAAVGRPEATALVGPRRALTYAELNAVVEARAEGWAGPEPGRPFPVTVAADLDGVVDLLALWRLGAIPLPLNPRLTEREREAAARALLRAELPVGTQVVLWTSGTSGRPRGVALSWDNLGASVDAAATCLELGPRDVWVASLSLAHVGGLVLVVRSLLLGGALIAPGAVDAEGLSVILDGTAGSPTAGSESGTTDDGSGTMNGEPAALRPTHCSLVPTQLHRILEHRAGRAAPESLACVLVGGAHASAAVVERALAEGWPLALTYGATEMTSQIATAPPDLVRRKPGTVGAALPGVELRVEADGGLLARGPTRALGYVAEESADLATDDGWYRTGDLGRLDEDGDLWITGRRADRIVTGGFTVDALEVEEAIRALPDVADTCVVGVPDEEWGERVGAWVEPVGEGLVPEEVERHLRGALSGPKLPRVWRVAPGLPRNANGKVDRDAVREALTQSDT